MLSRVADAIYWMSRYLERAENIARFIQVNWHMSLDHRPNKEFYQWDPLIKVTGDNDLFTKLYDEPTKQNVISFLTLDTNYPHSIISCFRAARENARTVRDIIADEMWEQINIFYHLIEDLQRNPHNVFDNPYDFCRDVKLRGMLLGGISNDTMNHGEAWHFFRLGRLMERADKTSRIVDVKYFILLPDLNYVDTAYNDIQWAALLRTTDALNAYRQLYGPIVPKQVVELLMLERDFPRSIMYCLLKGQESLRWISGSSIGTYRNLAERHLGQLSARLSYTDIDQIFDSGLHEFTDTLQNEMNAVDSAIAQTFFGYNPEEQ